MALSPAGWMSGLEVRLSLAGVQRLGNLGSHPCFGDTVLRVSAMTWLIKGIDLDPFISIYI